MQVTLPALKSVQKQKKRVAISLRLNLNSRHIENVIGKQRSYNNGEDKKDNRGLMIECNRE